MGNALKQGRLKKIVAGGQTGVDRAALDAALATGVAVGGWCPAGRHAEDGAIAPHYPLQETPSTDYAQRTAWNVRDSDGTLVLVTDTPKGGTTLTIQEAKQQGQPVLVVNLNAPPDVEAVSAWLATHEINVLNVAGPRESEAPGIYQQAFTFMTALLN